MTTDETRDQSGNTPEYVVQEAIYEHDDSRVLNEHIVAALRAARLLVEGALTDEQVEREAAERWPELGPDDAEWTYPRSVLRAFCRASFREGANFAAAGVAPPAPSKTRCYCFDLPRGEHHADCEPVPASSADRERQALNRVWAAMGCAWNPEEFRPVVRDSMWKQIIEWCEEQTAGNSRIYRENQQLQSAVLDARAPVDEAKLAEVVDNAQRRWNGSGRREPIATAITRDVLSMLRGV